MSMNWQKQFEEKDPNLFPAQMSDELMAKLPPHVVCTREWDNFRFDAEYYANRLRRHGKLLELYIHPGSCHYSFGTSPEIFADFKKIFDHYI